MAIKLPPLQALKSFATVAQRGSVTAAAEELCVTQSAVSHQLKKLEAWLQVRLIERVGRNVVLTDAGRRYSQALCECFARMEAETAKLLDGPSNQAVRISCLPMLGTSWMSSILPEFWAAYPNVEINLTFHRFSQPINPDDFDLAIHIGDLDNWPDYRVHPLLSGHAVVIASPLYRQHRKISSDKDIIDCDLLHETSRDFWSEWLKKAGFKREPSPSDITFQDGNLLLASTIAGEGVALLQYAAIQAQLKSGILVQLSDLILDEQRNYILLTPRDRPANRNVIRFREWLLAKARESSASVA